MYQAIRASAARWIIVRYTCSECLSDIFHTFQAKENADELVAKKKELDAQVLAKRAESKEFEQKMRQKASTVGNIVGKDVPVSLTEVRFDHCAILPN